MPHLCVLLWIVLSLCAKGNTNNEVEGRNVGDRCKVVCGGQNLICNTTSKTCQCRSGYTIEIQQSGKESSSTLCLAPAKLGEQCYHDLSCLPNDEHAECLQTHHRAECGCKADYHKILDKSTGTLKCVPETQLLNSDLATFIGVGVGMTLFCGLTCLVLRIFARARFGPRRHHYANAHLAPPITLSTEQGDGGINSRHSSQRSSIGGSRRQSMLAPPSRPGEGSRRASNSSIRSCSSARSYSLKNHQHRPSDPDTRLSPNKPPVEQVSSANVSPSTHSHPYNRSPHKGSRSSSTGALAIGTQLKSESIQVL